MRKLKVRHCFTNCRARATTAPPPALGSAAIALQGDTSSSGFTLKHGSQDHTVNQFASDSDLSREQNSLLSTRDISLPISPSTAQRMRNVKLTSENSSSRSAAVGASLSAQTVRDMRMILNQISINDSIGMQGEQRALEGNRGHDYDEVTQAKESVKEAVQGEGTVLNPQFREFTREGSQGRDNDSKASTTALGLRSSGSLFVNPTTLIPEVQGQGVGQAVGNLQEAYERKLLAAGQEVASLSASLETERRINDNLSAQLQRAADIGCEYFIEPAMDLDGEEQGEGQEEGEVDRRGQGQGQGLQASRYTTHKTYASFMQDAAQEIKEPDGEGTYVRYHIIVT